MDDLAAQFRPALEHMGLLPPGAPFGLEPLTGGVSSDIYRVDLPSGPVCVKRALARLKVQAEWRAPTDRNRYEVAWMRVAGAILPEAVPAVLGEDRDSGSFAMSYLDPDTHPVWKTLLRDGVCDGATAREVGRRLGTIHARTAARPDLAEQFATDHIFHPIRLEPYLVATARAHPDCAAVLEDLAARTLATKRTLVHGDVSPKNILVGPGGPVFLDAECAWYGDPAFDLAFCLNHLLLKCVWRPQWWTSYLQCFTTLLETYLAHVDWEPPEALEARVAHLLPGLLLARVDGKSPVEYITREDDRDRVRRAARALLLAPVDRLGQVRDAWREEIGAWRIGSGPGRRNRSGETP
jgi:aminoglycoside phosphotransferase (APT) family kinase protein